MRDRRRTAEEILYGSYLVQFRRLRAALRKNDKEVIRAAVLEVPRLESTDLKVALLAIQDVTTEGRRRAKDSFVAACV
jgi:hypothetical protein